MCWGIIVTPGPRSARAICGRCCDHEPYPGLANMRTTNKIAIRADLRTIFDLAARIEDWGELLPHYRYVRVLRCDGNRKRVRMSAWRDFVPVTWTAIQTVEPGSGDEPGRITFRHINGLVRGMDVEWWFMPRP